MSSFAALTIQGGVFKDQAAADLLLVGSGIDANAPSTALRLGDVNTASVNLSKNATATGLSTMVDSSLFSYWSAYWDGSQSQPLNLDTQLFIDGLPTPSNVLVNGDFETGDLTGWTVAGTGGMTPPSISNTQVHGGSWSCLVGMTTETQTGDATLTQNVTIPSGATATLSYWWWPATVDTITFDQQKVLIRTADGLTVLATVQNACQNDQTWLNVTYDMSAFAGQTVQVCFLVHEDGAGDATYMYVDDITVVVSSELQYHQQWSFLGNEVMRLDQLANLQLRPQHDATGILPLINSPQIHTDSSYFPLGGPATHVPFYDQTIVTVAGGELVQNGGFETGDFTDWTASWTGIGGPPIVQSGRVHSGTFAAQIAFITGGDLPNVSRKFIYTNPIIVPANPPMLSFWWWPFNVNVGSDAQIIEIRDSTGSSTLATIFNGLRNDQTWINTTFDLTPYAGQTITIYFADSHDGTPNGSGIWVDDVSIFQPAAYHHTWNFDGNDVLQVDQNNLLLMPFGSFDMADGTAAKLSATGHGRLRYNATTHHFEASIEGGAYASFGLGSTLAASYALGAGVSDSIIAEDATRGPLTIRANSLTGTIFAVEGTSLSDFMKVSALGYWEQAADLGGTGTPIWQIHDSANVHVYAYIEDSAGTFRIGQDFIRNPVTALNPEVDSTPLWFPVGGWNSASAVTSFAQIIAQPTWAGSPGSGAAELFLNLGWYFNPTMLRLCGGFASLNLGVVAEGSFSQTVDSDATLFAVTALRPSTTYRSLKSHGAFTGSDKYEFTEAIQTTDANLHTIYTLPLNSLTNYSIEARATCRGTAGAVRATLGRVADFYREGAGGVQQGATGTLFTDITTGGTIDLQINLSGNNALIQVKGVAATTINWVVEIEYRAISGNT